MRGVAALGKLTSPATVKGLLAEGGVVPDRRLGQHFLIDENVLVRITAASELGAEDLVLEIGAGIGTLTQRLAREAGRVVALELDRRLADIARRVLDPEAGTVRIVEGDALKTDLVTLVADHTDPGAGFSRLKVVANIPYYLTAPLVVRLLRQQFPLPLDRLVLMVQREVAERMAAGAGNREYGAFSLLVQYHARPVLVTRVPPSAFLPRPDVESAVVLLAVHRRPPVDVPPAVLFPVIRAAFAHRRKMLPKALAAGGLGVSKEEAAAAMARCGLDARRRGETLSLAEFAALARVLGTGGGTAPC